MSRQSRARSSTLFLLELILSILFFSIASAICLQFFVKAHLLSQQAQAENNAVNLLSAAAETVFAAESAEQAAALLQAQYPDSRLTGTGPDCTFTAGFDDSFAPCAVDEAEYLLTADLSVQDRQLCAQLAFAPPDGEAVYSLNIQHHLQRGRSDEAA